MSDETISSVDALLGRMDRVRGLARRLVKDAAEADDLVQEAVAAALARPVPVRDPGDGWIATVLRNLQRDRQRGAGRRSAREQAAARSEGGGHDTSALVANAERQKDVVEAVLSLEDPYRETLLMRFFEDLPPRRIVERTGRSPEAVKKHLSRGLALLRAKLEARYGDRGQWAVALLPVIGTKGLTGLGASAGAAVSAKGAAAAPPAIALRAAMALAMVMGIGVPTWILWGGGRSAATPARDGDLARVGDAAERDALVPIAAESSGRDEAASAAETAGGSHAAPADDSDGAPAIYERRVVLIDLAGQPIANREVRWPSRRRSLAESSYEEHQIAVTTDAEGAAVLRGPTDPNVDGGIWFVDEQRYVVAGDAIQAGGSLIVLAPSVNLRGQTVDADGVAVPGVHLGAWVHLDAVSGFPASLLPRFGPRQIGCKSDAQGAFELLDIPAHQAFQVHVDAEGRYDTRIPLPQVDALNMRVEVGRVLPPRRWLTGTVVHEGGEPAGGAEVRYGWQEAVADERGRFRIELPSRPEGTVVLARVADGRFITEPSPAAALTAKKGDVLEDAVVLRIPAAMDELRGRLVDDAGEPLAGFEAVLFDGTYFGGSSQVLERNGELRDLKTDDEGRFRFPLCGRRPYRVRFIDAKSMLVHESGPLLPGPREHEVVLGGGGVVSRLEGKVIDVHGAPVAGASVKLQTRTTPPDASFTMYRAGMETTTDDNGRFELLDAPWRHLEVAVSARSDVRMTSTIDGGVFGDTAPDGPVVITVDLPCRVELAERSDVRRVEALDAGGESLTVCCIESGVSIFRPDVRRTKAGPFPPFEVSQRAVTLRLIGENGEIGRVPVQLDVKGSNAVEL